MSCWAEATLATSRPQNSRAVSTGGVLVSPGKQETAGNKSRDPRMAGQQACWAGQTDLDRGFQGCHPRDPLWMSNLLCRAIATGKCAHNQQPLGGCGWPGGRERGQCVCVCTPPSCTGTAPYTDVGTLEKVHPPPLLFTVSFVYDPYSSSGSHHSLCFCHPHPAAPQLPKLYPNTGPPWMPTWNLPCITRP